MFELHGIYALSDLPNFPIEYVSLLAKSEGRWIVIHDRERNTWDLPGGKIEVGETPGDAAGRELWEETGATEAHFFPLFVYSILSDRGVTYGLQYFVDVLTLGPLPDFEIDRISLVDEVDLSTLRSPQVHRVLLEKVGSLLSRGILSKGR